MNLHSIVSPIVGAVNVNQTVALYQSVGYVTNTDFSRTPTYLKFTMRAQIQGLSSDDIRLLNGLGIQGERRRVYLWGTWSGMVRSLRKGNDLLVTPDGSTWKVALVFEDYGHGASGVTGWCSVAIVLQNPASEGLPPPGIDIVTTVSLTADYNVLATDTGTYFDNDSTSVPIIVTLPTPTPGLNYHFTVTSAQTFMVTAPSGVSIALGNADTTPGGGVNSNQLYSSVFIYAPSGAVNQYVAESETGGWNVD